MAFRIIQPNYISGGPPVSSTLLSGLVAAYPLTDAPSPYADLVAGNDMDSVLNGPLGTITARGGVLSAADFEVSSSQKICIATPPTAFNLNTFTISAWVNLESTDANRIVAGSFNSSFPSATDGRFRLTVDFTRPKIEVSDGTTIINARTAANAVLAGSGWHLIIASYDSVSGELNVYTDDRSTYNANANTGYTTLYSGTFGLGIGGNAVAGSSLGKMWDGGIEDVWIWNRVLTSDEMDELWSSGAGVKFEDL